MSQSFIRIKSGVYRNSDVSGRVFQLVEQYKVTGKGGYVTVVNGGAFPGFPEQIRVKVAGPGDYEFVSGSEVPADVAVVPAHTPVPVETDEEVMTRIRERFEILDEMTKAATNGEIRAMIVSGPPGVGKSFGVERVLEQAALFDKMAQRKPRFEVVKGAMSAVGLYCKLFQYADSNSVLVFDDCDSILLDDLSLNILKAALDSGSKRTISWNTDSRMLRSEGVPDRFDFKGSVIFITNIKFEHVRSKKLKDHLDALESRCHYLDLTMDTQRDKFLRIKQIVRDGMLDKYDFEEGAADQIVEYVWENRNRLRELSLRTVLKIADLRAMSAHNWKRLAETTILKRA